ncbi:MAG: FAD-binding protein [Legionella sp.]|nr:MAG: FAD-binding protein [Legionella sp.]
MSHNNIDVLIVGAGPVGLFCANELIRHGLTCRIIDKKSNLSERSKALGLHIRTLDIFRDCSFINEVQRQGHQVEGVLFKSKGKTIVNATFADIDASYHYLIDLPQNQTEAIFNQALEDKGVYVEWDTELTHLSQSPTEIMATIRKPNNKIELFNANWLIACDGAHSTVRHEVNAEFKGSAYQQAWWLADLIVDWEVPENRMAIYISPNGPLACFPMGNKRYRLVMSAPQGSSGDPSLSEIEQIFQERSTDKAILSNPIWLSQFSIHHRQIEHYRYDRVFFAGDAAHIHSPMGGQGLNTGIQDIYNLAWKLALVEKRKAKPELLDSYNAERFPVGQEVLKKTDLMTRMILLKNPLLVDARNAFIKFITSFKTVKNTLAKDIAELSISYAKSPIVQQSGCVKHLKAGEYFPEFHLTDSQTGNTLKSSTIVQGTMHHAFIFCGNNSKKIPELINFADKLASKYCKTVKVHLVLNKPQEANSGRLQTWIDDEQIHQRFNIKKPTLVLVRPDKYMGLLKKPLNKKTQLQDLYLLT